MTENVQINLRVFAVNHAGKSQPCEYYQIILVRDTMEVPSADVRNYASNTVSVCAGQSLKINLPLASRPLPKYVLYKGCGGTDKLKPNERTTVNVDDSKIAHLDQCQEDSDTYVLHMKSAVGEACVAMNVVILDEGVLGFARHDGLVCFETKLF